VPKKVGPVSNEQEAFQKGGLSKHLSWIHAVLFWATRSQTPPATLQCTLSQTCRHDGEHKLMERLETSCKYSSQDQMISISLVYFHVGWERNAVWMIMLLQCTWLVYCKMCLSVARPSTKGGKSSQRCGQLNSVPCEARDHGWLEHILIDYFFSERELIDYLKPLIWPAMLSFASRLPLNNELGTVLAFRPS
jgi:hypothetical protein